MEDLRFALLVIGGCAIVAILAHGLWSLRKNNATPKPRVEPQQDFTPTRETEGFDEYGIGEVRVVSRQPSGDDDTNQVSSDECVVVDTLEAQFDVDEGLKTSPESVATVYPDNSEEPSEDTIQGEPKVSLNDIPSTGEIGSESTVTAGTDSTPTQVEVESEPEPAPPKLYASVVSNPKPKMYQAREDTKPTVESKSESIPEPPPFLLNPDQVTSSDTSSPVDTETTTPNEVDDFSLDQAPIDAELQTTPVKAEVAADVKVTESKKAPTKKRSRSILRKRIEPTLGEDQMRMSFDEETPVESTQAAPESPAAQDAPEQEVLVLNVRAPQDQEIQGAALLPMLLTLGFKFGDQDIFHRHVNSNGKGPVLFSLANMFKPGVFDIDNLENFTTQGVSLFMILPIEGDPHQVFNMMHNAARKLAEEFSGQILDGRRSVLTKQGLQQYVEKIREFERRRMIARH
ncbi:cell division protein ZipA [Alteromonas sp. ASW11-36]|uniref:Cell division protein ZipA n=1 Tax=Alteromonas arenosi TaxID=3055817 RepID=A0ABT7SWV6_9ALTE|nr:cell division protein ZipA [Alteromonas sp. ASW11-36]MDM7860658.1 cell division protein ZipA [Alteromonas sp. ASW11-36]